MDTRRSAVSAARTQHGTAFCFPDRFAAGIGCSPPLSFELVSTVLPFLPSWLLRQSGSDLRTHCLSSFICGHSLVSFRQDSSEREDTPVRSNQPHGPEHCSLHCRRYEAFRLSDLIPFLRRRKKPSPPESNSETQFYRNGSLSS